MHATTFRKAVHLLTVTMLTGVLVACAAGPLEFEQQDSPLSVMQVNEIIADQARTDWGSSSEKVLWGGTVISVSNLTDATQLEIMAYPLDRRQRPMIGRAAQGRFIAQFEGFLEPLNYSPGRIVTVTGTITDPVSGSVGEVTTVYPAIQVWDSHLWSPQELSERSGVTFGIGINLGN